MGSHFCEEDSFVCIVELTPTMRKRIEDSIEQLLMVLDYFDGDENLEEENEHGGDILDEPHDGLEDDEYDFRNHAAL